MLNSTSDLFIKTDDIKIISNEVTQEINPQYLDDFIKTTLKINNILINDELLIWHTFIKEVNIYKIYIIYCEKNTIDIYPNILRCSYNNLQSNTIDLFILDNFFAIYKYGNLYYFKSIKNSSSDDIKNYVIKTYKLNIDTVVKIDKIQFDKLSHTYKSLENNCKKTNKTIFINLKQNKQFSIFIYFIIFCIISFVLTIYFIQNDKISTTNKQLKNLKTRYDKLKNNKSKIKHQNIASKTISLFKFIHLQNLIIKKLTSKNNKISLELLHIDKTKLLNFLTIYNEKIFIKNLEFIKKDNLYKMAIEIEF
jgi:hypothetical protein